MITMQSKHFSLLCADFITRKCKKGVIFNIRLHFYNVIKYFFAIKNRPHHPDESGRKKTNYLMKKINTTFCQCDKHPAKQEPQAKDHR